MLAQNNNIYLPQLNCRLDNFKQKMRIFVMFLFYYICDELQTSVVGRQRNCLGVRDLVVL